MSVNSAGAASVLMVDDSSIAHGWNWVDLVLETAVAEVTAAGYFNEGRKSLYKNMLILADCDIDGTPAVALLRVINVPDSGNVTVAIQDLTAAP